MHTCESVVPVRSPFDFGLTLEFLRGFSPMMGEQTLAPGALTKAWLHRETPVTVTVSAREGGVACAMTSPKRIDDTTERAVADRVASFLSADEDLAEFYAIAARDRAFAPVAKKLRGLHHPKFATPFEAACWGVINQRVQRAQARKMKAAIVAAWGAKGCDAFPEPKTLARATEAQFVEILGNAHKARAVFSVSQAFAQIDEKWLQTAPIAAVEGWLRRIWGVGDFTTGFVLYRGLGRAIGLPWSESFVTAARKTYPGATRASLERTSEAYGAWKGHWSLYLWAATFVRPD